MKTWMAVFSFNGMIGRDQRARATLASALAIVLAMVVAAPTARANDGSPCPSFTADDVDENFVDWAALTGFDPDTGALICFVSPGTPHLAFRATNADYSKFVVTIVPSSNDPTRNTSLGCTEDALGDSTCWSNTDDLFDYDLLPKSQAFACRAEVVRSSTWRQLCAGDVTKP